MLAASLLAGGAAAQVVYQSAELTEADAVAAEDIRRYQVEIIVFEHNESRQSGKEIFLPEVANDGLALELPQLKPGEVPEITRIGPVSAPNYDDRGSLFGVNSPVALDQSDEVDRSTPEYQRWLEQQPLLEVPSHILQTRLNVLDAETYAMPEIYRTLSRLGAYKPIMRAAWTQAVHEQENTLPIDLRRVGNAPLYLDGEITLYLSRFLHLVVDLHIDAGEAVLETEDRGTAQIYGDQRMQNNFDERNENATAPIRYRIFEDRIFRNGEIRYYDHPKLGVLARITRVADVDED